MTSIWLTPSFKNRAVQPEDGPLDPRVDVLLARQPGVPLLSAVVYRSVGRIPRSKAAPAISLNEPAPSEEARGRIHVSADVGGSSFYEVTFQARIGDDDWTSIGTDDAAPYQVFHDVNELAPGTPVSYRAVVLDNGRHTRSSEVATHRCPRPC